MWPVQCYLQTHLSTRTHTNTHTKTLKHTHIHRKISPSSCDIGFNNSRAIRDHLFSPLSSPPPAGFRPPSYGLVRRLPFVLLFFNCFCCFLFHIFFLSLFFLVLILLCLLLCLTLLLHYMSLLFCPSPIPLPPPPPPLLASVFHLPDWYGKVAS